LLIDSIGHQATFAVLLIVVVLAMAMIWFNRALLPTRDRRVSGTEPLHPLELLKHTELRHVLIADGTDLHVLGLADLRDPGAWHACWTIGRRDRLCAGQLRARDVHYPAGDAAAVAAIHGMAGC
jgi:hypothetical protein